MTSFRIIKHEPVEGTGSFEVQVSTFFHFENAASRRLRQEQKTREEALADAQRLARDEQDRLGSQ